MPTSLSEYLTPFAQQRFPPAAANPSRLGFNIEHFAAAMNDGSGRQLASDRRTLRKVFEEGVYPQEPWLRQVCQILNVPYDSLPPRPSGRVAAMQEELRIVQARLAYLEERVTQRELDTDEAAGG